ncbi:MAG: DUF1116 domain-containing protein [Anaerotruncus sp.]|nr:DUF1116 domain-containing protein [Anaerotruncus sp.]
MKLLSVRKDSYHDSVFLMLATQELKASGGVVEAVVAMGTDMNRDLLSGMGFGGPDLDGAGPNDLLVAVEARDEVKAEAAAAKALELVDRKKTAASAAGGSGLARTGSLDAALARLPKANLAVISLPGTYAAREARKALDRGLHVMLFSDNVPLEEEVDLKRRAAAKGLLVMGPDCGTAIVNGQPLCFANVVRRGTVAWPPPPARASRKLTCLVDRYGAGISQAIGTGGRDLKNAAVGGRTMLLAIAALAADPATSVIVVISKPPAPDTARERDGRAARSGQALRRALPGPRGPRGSRQARRRRSQGGGPGGLLRAGPRPWPWGTPTSPSSGMRRKRRSTASSRTGSLAALPRPRSTSGASTTGGNPGRRGPVPAAADPGAGLVEQPDGSLPRASGSPGIRGTHHRGPGGRRLHRRTPAPHDRPLHPHGPPGRGSGGSDGSRSCCWTWCWATDPTRIPPEPLRPAWKRPGPRRRPGEAGCPSWPPSPGRPRISRAWRTSAGSSEAAGAVVMPSNRQAARLARANTSEGGRPMSAEPMNTKPVLDLFSGKLGGRKPGPGGVRRDPGRPGVPTVQVDWKPPAGGRKDVIEALDAIARNPRRGRGKRGSPVPDPGGQADPGRDRHSPGHRPGHGPGPDPPRGSSGGMERHGGPLRGAVIGGLLYEGLASDAGGSPGPWQPPERSASSPATTTPRWGRWPGVMTASMPVWIVENQAFGEPGLLHPQRGARARCSATAPTRDEVLDRLRWMARRAWRRSLRQGPGPARARST